MTAVDDYRELLTKLQALCRKAEPDEDLLCTVLDNLDRIWDKELTASERKTLNQEYR